MWDALARATLAGWTPSTRRAASAGEPDQALEIARTVADIAVETRSARMRRELVTLQRAMRPWKDAPVGRDLAEILAPVTEGS